MLETTPNDECSEDHEGQQRDIPLQRRAGVVLPLAEATRALLPERLERLVDFVERA
jgi:hypothetical protein